MDRPCIHLVFQLNELFLLSILSLGDITFRIPLCLSFVGDDMSA